MCRLPKPNNDVRLKWINRIQRCRPNWSPNKWSYVCSRHFKPEDFDRTGLFVRLRDGVAPSVFEAPASPVSRGRRRRQPTTRTNDSSQQSTAMTGNFWISRLFKVINLNTPKKAVSSACYDMVPVSLFLSAIM